MVLPSRKVRNGKISLHGSDVKWGIWVLKHLSGSYEQEHFCSTWRDIVRGDLVGEGPFLLAQPTEEGCNHLLHLGTEGTERGKAVPEEEAASPAILAMALLDAMEISLSKELT